MVAVIKYVCTSRVLQRRATLLRSQITEIEDSYKQLEADRSNLEKIIRKFQQALFGKAKEAEALQTKIRTLTTENEALKVEAETSKAYTELLEKFESLQKAFDKESKRRKELGRNNQSLGGRVAHTNRFRRERDEARAILAEQKEQIDQLIRLNQTLETQNKSLSKALNAQLAKQQTSSAS
jgi:chromosome segregation ATPase